jgi:hypothetical protein
MAAKKGDYLSLLFIKGMTFMRRTVATLICFLCLAVPAYAVTITSGTIISSAMTDFLVFGSPTFTGQDFSMTIGGAPLGFATPSFTAPHLSNRLDFRALVTLDGVQYASPLNTGSMLFNGLLPSAEQGQHTAPFTMSGHVNVANEGGVFTTLSLDGSGTVTANIAPFFGVLRVQNVNFTFVPEPTTLLLLAFGLTWLALVRWRKSLRN